MRVTYGNPHTLQPVRRDRCSKQQFLNMLDRATWLYQQGRNREIPALMQDISRVSWEWFHFRAEHPAQIAGEWK